MKIEFQPQGVCARQIIIDIENDIVNLLVVVQEIRKVLGH